MTPRTARCRVEKWACLLRLGGNGLATPLGTAPRTAGPTVHPAELLLEEFLEPTGLSQHRLAKDFSVPRRRVSEVVHGNPRVTADTACVWPANRNNAEVLVSTSKPSTASTSKPTASATELIARSSLTSADPDARRRDDWWERLQEVPHGRHDSGPGSGATSTSCAMSGVVDRQVADPIAVLLDDYDSPLRELVVDPRQHIEDGGDAFGSGVTDTSQEEHSGLRPRSRPAWFRSRCRS